MPVKYKESICPKCEGQGVLYYTTTKFFGLVKNEVAYACTECEGRGRVRGEPFCPVCDGAGLIGNERELCRTCNGTGTGDEFRHVPRGMLSEGNTFSRRCDKCKAETLHEFVTDIETKVITTTWEKDEWKRQKDEFERIKIECSVCGQSYYAKLDKYFHSEAGYVAPGDEEGEENRKKRLWGQDFSSPSEIFK